MSTTVVMADRLTFRYGTEAVVRDISLTIPERSIFGFVGPNGAGKSTTIKLMLGLLTPNEGTVHVFGRDIAAHRSEILRQTGSLVETPSLYPHLTAEENLDLVRRVRAVPRPRIDAVLHETGIQYAKRRKVKEFSLGMKQRLGIALALLHEPRLLVLDEPINGLDPEGIQEFRTFLKQLVNERKVTVLLSSHILSELEQAATHAGIIARGTMRFQGTLEELIRQQDRRLILEVSDVQKAVTLLEGRHPAIADHTASTVSIRAVNRQEAAQINTALTTAGISVYRMQFEQPNLESVFLDLTRNGGGV